MHVLIGIAVIPFDVDACHVHPIDVVGVPEVGRIAILLSVGDQANLHTRRGPANQLVGHLAGGDAEHGDVDLLRLVLHPGDEAILIVLVRWKVQLGIQVAPRIRRVISRQRPRDVREVGVVRGVRPEVVVLLHERLDDNRIGREVNRFVHVLDVFATRLRRRVRAVREVRGAEMDGVLPPVHHHLPVVDAGRELMADRDPRVDEQLPEGRASGVARIGTQVEQNPHRDASLPALDDLARVTPVGHEPVRDIDAGRLGPDHLEDGGAAVLEGVVTELVCRSRRHLRGGGRRTRQNQREGCDWDEPVEQLVDAGAELGERVQGPFRVRRWVRYVPYW